MKFTPLLKSIILEQSKFEFLSNKYIKPKVNYVKPVCYFKLFDKDLIPLSVILLLLYIKLLYYYY
jgi:hypothetical protein